METVESTLPGLWAAAAVPSRVKQARVRAIRVTEGKRKALLYASGRQRVSDI